MIWPLDFNCNGAGVSGKIVVDDDTAVNVDPPLSTRVCNLLLNPVSTKPLRILIVAPATEELALKLLVDDSATL